MQTVSFSDRAESAVKASLKGGLDIELSNPITYQTLPSIQQLVLIESLIENDDELRELVIKKINNELSDAQQRLARNQVANEQVRNMRSFQEKAANLRNEIIDNQLNPSNNVIKRINKAYSNFFKQQGE